MLRAYLFGGLELSWDESPLPAPPGAAPRSLLAYLLAYHGRPHTRDLLAGTFWPDLPDATARRRLSQALWQIGQAWRQGSCRAGAESPPPLLQAEAAAVQLNPGLPVWLDSEEFAAHYAHCTSAAAGAAEAGALAVGLYRGEFLAGYYEDWAVLERERLHGMLLEALRQLLEGHKGAREYERALAYAERLVAEDPWDEGAHRELMRLYHLAGRDAEALAQFESCRRILAAELGSVPSAETEALAAEIAAQAGLPPPLVLPSAARPVGAPLLERPDLLPLVGRRAEMSELVRQLEAAAQGQGRLTLVYGEAGVGKSRLLRELEANAHWRGVRTAWGRCYELAAPLAYQSLVEALRAQLPALNAAALAPLWRGELSRLLPELAPGGPMPSTPAPPEDAGRLLEAIARAFLALTERGPFLLLLEDAHWMDPASLGALRYLLPRLADAPLLIVVSARSEELAGRPAAALAAMESTRLPCRLDLARLDLPETAELLQRALDLRRPAPRFSARLYAETEGNPFFLVETLWALVQEGVLQRDEAGGWSTPWDESTADYAELPLPAGVAQSITHRLDRLPAALRELLQLAAVIGREVDFRLWQAASGTEEEALLAAGDELRARALLLAVPDPDAAAALPAGRGTASADYTFAHDLIRRVSYERLAGPRRRAYHRRVAEALTRLAPDEPAPLAYHWTQARAWDRAASFHQRAGDQARAIYANADAASHYTQALESLQRLPGPADLERRYDLLQAREAVHDLLGDRQSQLLDLQALEALAVALNDDGRRADAALRLAGRANATGSFPEAIAASQAAIDLAHRAGDRGLEAKAYLRWGQALWHQGTYGAARTQLDQALNLAEAALLTPVVADARLSLGRVFLAQGDYAQARDSLARAAELYLQVGDARGHSEALENLGRLNRLQGIYAEAGTYFEQALRGFGEIGDRRGEGRLLQCLGSVATSRGDYAEAEGYFLRALRIAREIGDREVQSSLLGSLGVVYNRRCAYGQARLHFEQALDICREIGDRRGEVIDLTNLGIILWCQGDYDQAAVYAGQSRQLGREIGDRRYEGWALHTLGRIAMHQGIYAGARSFFEQGLDLSRELGDRQLESVLLYSMGLLAHHTGDDRAAEEYSRQSLRVIQEIDEPVDVGYALVSLGRALAGQGRMSEAGDAFRQATELRRGLGQGSLAAESQAALAGIALAQGDVARATGLVEEILAYLQAGILDGAEEPLQALLTCYLVLQAVHDPRAAPLLATAHDLLQQRAAGIADEALRRSFLEEVAAHREIIRAYRDAQTTREQRRQLTASLPRADAPLGRPLRPDEYVSVTWTVHAPEDDAAPDKVARRHLRVARLLAEARAQGAAPRAEDIAAALDVSLVTVRRDMAALRAAGHGLPRRRGPRRG